MDIPNITKDQCIHTRKIKSAADESLRGVPTEENSRYVSRNKVDRAEISANYSGHLEDKKISVAKSSILYEVSVKKHDERVQELKDSVASGTYRVPSDVLAEELLK